MHEFFRFVSRWTLFFSVCFQVDTLSGDSLSEGDEEPSGFGLAPLQDAERPLSYFRHRVQATAERERRHGLTDRPWHPDPSRPNVGHPLTMQA